MSADSEGGGLLELLARLASEGKIHSYRVEREGDTLRLYVVPVAWAEFVDVDIGFADLEPEPVLRTCEAHDLYGCPLCDLELETT